MCAITSTTVGFFRPLQPLDLCIPISTTAISSISMLLLLGREEVRGSVMVLIIIVVESVVMAILQ